MPKKRKSIRLKNFDYASAGTYFITICTHDRQHLFGTIEMNHVELNATGRIIENAWMQTPLIRTNVMIDEFIIMPNHIHAIIHIIERRGVLPYAPTTLRSPSQTIGAIVRGFKSTTTKQINILQKSPYQPVWQRNFYDHIIRNEKSLNQIRQYIQNNPENWNNDEYQM